MLPKRNMQAVTSTPDEPTITLHDSLTVEVVFRFRVPEPKKEPFRREVEKWAHGEGPSSGSGTAGESQSRVTLWQPVVGSDPDVWEVRVSFLSHASLGQLMDDHPARLSELQHLDVESVEALDVANPVLRRVGMWTTGPSSDAARPAPGDAFLGGDSDAVHESSRGR